MNKVIFADEFHIAKKRTRIKHLELEIQKIKTGVTKATSSEILNNVLAEYEKEFDELKMKSNNINF